MGDLMSLSMFHRPASWRQRCGLLDRPLHSCKDAYVLMPLHCWKNVPVKATISWGL